MSAWGRDAWRVGRAVLVTLLAAGCGSENYDGPADASRGDGWAIIGSKGGELTVATRGEHVNVRVAPGALSADTRITATRADDQGPAGCPVWDLGPAGTRFADSAIVELSCDAGRVRSVLPGLAVAVSENARGPFQKLAVADVVPAARNGSVAAGATTHFSFFTLVPAAGDERWELLDASGTSFTAGPVTLTSRDAVSLLSMSVSAWSVELLLGESALIETELTITGLLPSAALHVYVGGHRDDTALVVDGTGTARFAQRLGGERRAVMLQIPSGTFFLDGTQPGGGACEGAGIGTWDAAAATCRRDPAAPPLVDTVDLGPGVTLDCAGTTIDATSLFDAVLLSGPGARLDHCVALIGFRGVTVLPAASGTVIERCDFRGTGTLPIAAIHYLGVAGGGLVRDSDFACARGVSVTQSAGVRVTASRFTAAQAVSVLGAQSAALRFDDNDIVTTSSAAVSSFGVSLADGPDSLIEGNRLVGVHPGNGISLGEGVGSVRIAGNDIRGYSIGTFAGGPAAVITANVLAGNLTGLEIGTTAGAARVFLNDIFANTVVQVSALVAIELSDQDPASPTFGFGNYYGHGCIDGPPFFDAMVDAFGPALDSHPFGIPVAGLAADEVPTPPACPVGPVDADGDEHLSTAMGGDDCDDLDPAAYPGAPEWCDSVDNDCDAQVDDSACEPASFTPVIPDAPIPATHRTFFPRQVVAQGESVLIDVPATAVEPTLYVSTTDHRGLGPHPFLLNGVDPLPPLPGPPPSPSSKAIFLPLPVGTSLVEMTGPRGAALVEGVDRSYRCLLLEQELERGKGSPSTELFALAVHESESVLSVTVERDLATGPGSLHAALETEATGGSGGAGGAGGAAGGGGILLCSDVGLSGLEFGEYEVCPPPPPPPSELSPAVIGTATVKLAGAPGGSYTLAVESFDAVAPQGTLAVASGLVTCEQEIEIAGDADGDTVSVTVDGQTATLTRVQGLVHFSAQVSPSFGVNHVEVCMTDVCENRSCASVSVLVGRAERCDGVDNDCDLAIDEDFDRDGDGYFLCGSSLDCDDTRADVHPDAVESCDGVDNDCDTQSDEGLSVDADGDGHFAPGSCAQPADDCDDGSSECDADCSDADSNFIPDCRDHTKAWDYGASTTRLRTFALSAELDRPVRGFLVQTLGAVSLDVASASPGGDGAAVTLALRGFVPHEPWILRGDGGADIAVEADAAGDLTLPIELPSSIRLHKDPGTIRITDADSCPGTFGPGGVFGRAFACFIQNAVLREPIEIAMDDLVVACVDSGIAVASSQPAAISVEGSHVTVLNCAVSGGLVGIEVTNATDVRLLGNRVHVEGGLYESPRPAIGIHAVNSTAVLLDGNVVPVPKGCDVGPADPLAVCHVPMLFGVKSTDSEVTIESTVIDGLAPVTYAYVPSGSPVSGCEGVFMPSLICFDDLSISCPAPSISVTAPVAVMATGGELTLRESTITDVWGAPSRFGVLDILGSCRLPVDARGAGVAAIDVERLEMQRNTLDRIGGLSLQVLGSADGVSVFENNFTGHLDDAVLVRSHEALEMSKLVDGRSHGNFWDRSASPLFVPGVMAHRATDSHPFCTRDGWLSDEVPCACAGNEGCIASGALQASPGSLSFGDVAVGEVAGPSTITVDSNGSRDPILFGFIATGGPDDLFPTGVPFAIDPGATTCVAGDVVDGPCQIGITVSPHVPCRQTALVLLASDTAASPQAIPLDVFGTAPASPAVEPPFVRLGPTIRGMSSSRQSVIVRNTGTEPLAVTGVSIESVVENLFEHGGGCAAAALSCRDDHESCEIKVWIAPVVEREYPHHTDAELVITTSAGEVRVALQGLVNPCIPSGPEVCDGGIDNDCDGLVDEGFDADGDGYTPCGDDPLGTNADCDDGDVTVFPGQRERCDQVDNDCDGELNELDPENPLEANCDGDAFSGPAAFGDYPGLYEHLVSIGLADCDDLDHTIYPGAPLRCNRDDHNDCMLRCDLDPDADCSGVSRPQACEADLVHSMCASSDLRDCWVVERDLAWPDPSIVMTGAEVSQERFDMTGEAGGARSMLGICREPVALTAYSGDAGPGFFELAGEVWSSGCYPEQPPGSSDPPVPGGGATKPLDRRRPADQLARLHRAHNRAARERRARIRRC